MDLRIFTEPQQGATYHDLLRVAQACEQLEFDAFFRSDHYLAMNSEGLPGPTDAWLTLAGIARETTTIRLGTLVTSATFRFPGPLAISVAQVDEMSGGRVEFGLGAGWFAEEHSAYAIPFPTLPERFDRLEESLEIITGLWKTPLGKKFNYDGQYFSLENSPALPKPVQHPMPPLIIGGMGKNRTPKLAARFANEFNLPFISVQDSAKQIARVRAACEGIERQPESMIFSNALVVCGGSTELEIRRRASSLRRDLSELADNGLAGSADQIVDKIGTYQRVGSERIYLQILDLTDLDHLEFIATKILPQLD
ncbi:MAG: LLM class F420-dependent oxidoreductase [Mycobacteriaceae bacterium]